MLLDGLSRKSAAPTDKSMTPPPGSVNEPTRTTPAATPKTLGPRTA